MTRIVDDAVARLRAHDATRAQPQQIDDIVCSLAGDTRLPLKHIAGITVRPPRTFVVTPWDPGSLRAIVSALSAANLGALPSTTDGGVTLTLPPPGPERREAMRAAARRSAEDGRIAIRGVRRDLINRMRRDVKAGVLREATMRGRTKDIDAATAECIARIDDALAAVEQELSET